MVIQKHKDFVEKVKEKKKNKKPAITRNKPKAKSKPKTKPTQKKKSSPSGVRTPKYKGMNPAEAELVDEMKKRKK
ncbi:MAG TPA: hypothetical protein VMW55_08120 [Nitrosopumilaceae archaeon]|nr:hypothetical protein [Nitrosopumilaceae archaeon]